jgi:hypothetical protein
MKKFTDMSKSVYRQYYKVNKNYAGLLLMCKAIIIIALLMFYNIDSASKYEWSPHKQFTKEALCVVFSYNLLINVLPSLAILYQFPEAHSQKFLSLYAQFFINVTRIPLAFKLGDEWFPREA